MFQLNLNVFILSLFIWSCVEVSDTALSEIHSCWMKWFHVFSFCFVMTWKWLMLIYEWQFRCIRQWKGQKRNAIWCFDANYYTMFLGLMVLEMARGQSMLTLDWQLLLHLNLNAAGILKLNFLKYPFLNLRIIMCIRNGHYTKTNYRIVSKLDLDDICL